GDAPPGPWASMAAEVLKETTSYQIATSQPGEPTVAVQWGSKPVDIQWPTTWRVFGPLPRTSKLLPGSAVKTMPRALTADGNEYEGRELSTVEDTLDLTCLYGGYGLKPLAPGEKPTAFPRPKARSDAKAQSKLAYAMAEIDCPAAGRLTIGACADWWMAWYLDGNCIYDPNTNEDTWAYCGRRGRLFWADVSAGRHVLAVALRASRGGWNVTAEGGAKSEPKFQAAMAGIPHSDVMQGYALVWGIGSGRLAEEIARQSRLHVVVVDPDAKKVEAFRRRLDAAGLYGTRVAVLPGDPLSLDLPPYFAELITSEDISGLLADPAADSGKGKAFAAKVFGCLRPYGGVACLPVEADRQKAFVQWAAAAGLEEAQVTRAGELALLRRKGAVDGSTDWTHEGADASNSLASRDWSVKAPLRVLWFGGSMDLLFPDWDFTHSRHPIPLVVGGRVFIQQAWTLAAADIYTGRLLWKVALPAPEHAYHSYAAAEDGVYVVCDGEVLRLDAATGRTLAHIAPFKGARGPWRQLRLWHDLLIGRVGSSLVAVDRAGGEALWSHQCKHGPVDFAIGGGKAYLLDCPAPGKGYKATSEARLIALDAKGGQVLWEAPETVWTGPRSEPHLAYSHLNDLLVVQHRDLHAYNATTGKPLWKQQAKQAVPYVLHRSAVVNAKTGEQFDPLTGGKRPQRLWTNRLRGCSHAVASEYLLTVRDGHATYFDLPSGKRTFMRGLRSGCTPSLIPADGLLNIPNFARGCSCNYSIFTSSALVPVPAEP
ncbi:MAG: PQQ-binding-like beta-propeller repeat protein, partial [Phycisphaerae bacterium]